MAAQDETQTTWDKVKDGFQERLGNHDQSALEDDQLSPEEEAALSDDMGSYENGDESIIDPVEDIDNPKIYSDEDQA